MVLQVHGFDADLCRAIAAAILGAEGIEEKMEWFDAGDSGMRFYYLLQHDIDVLSRTTTANSGRETLGIKFATPTLYDGQGLLVKTASGIRTLQVGIRLPHDACIARLYKTNTLPLPVSFYYSVV